MKSTRSVLASAFVIKNEQMDLRVAAVDLDRVLLHEAFIPEYLERLTAEIKKDGCLNNPIIVDSESLLILDGVHRAAALKKLGCKWVPALLVDYGHPLIQVFSWYRTIKGKDTPAALTDIKETALRLEKVDQINEKLLGIPPTVAGLKTVNDSFLLDSEFKTLKDAYDIIARVEKHLQTLGFQINYETEDDALQSLVQCRADAVLLTPRLTKKVIVDMAHSGKFFGRKTSRHIIPSRPMHACVPLSLLRSNKPLLEINKELNRILEKKRLTRVPPGSVFEGRRYDEDLYVFEEAQCQ